MGGKVTDLSDLKRVGVSPPLSDFSSTVTVEHIKPDEGVYAYSLFTSSPVPLESVYFFTLNILNNAKQPYNSPTGYATNNLCLSILRTATNIALAEWVHQTIDKILRK